MLTYYAPCHALLRCALRTGTTYRTREEVGSVRQARDPIEYVKKLLVDEKLATADELKQVEKEIRNEVFFANAYSPF